MNRNVQPRGYSASGYFASVDGRLMEFATYDEFKDYVYDRNNTVED